MRQVIPQRAARAPPLPSPAMLSHKLYSVSRSVILRLAEEIRETLVRVPYRLPEGSSVSIKSLLESLLPLHVGAKPINREIKDFCLCCAALASAERSESPSVYWIPKALSLLARSAMREISAAGSFIAEHEMIAELMYEVLPELKKVVKETCVDPDNEEFLAASARAPVANAIVAAHQFRWLVAQVTYPHLGIMCSLVVPCALTALDHWSPEVKEQGMLAIIHLGNNVTAAELGWYEEAILDVCCHNIAATDELWSRVVEVIVLLLTCTQRKNPRSIWFERMLTEMLNHLERQPFHRERRITWLQHIEPVFDVMGLVILLHFHRIFPLFFEWLHAADDETVLLVIKRIQTVIKVTWVRKSPYMGRLVDELVISYKEAEHRNNSESIQDHILDTLILLQKCKGSQFEMSWNKYREDANLEKLIFSLGGEAPKAQQLEGNSELCA